MKKFRFRLEQALRWRETQVRVQEIKLAAARGRLTAARLRLQTLQDELARAVEDCRVHPTGTILGSFDRYSARIEKHIESVRGAIVDAEEALREELRVLDEANRRVKVLERLKADAHEKWSAEVDRELEAFAAEAFLVRR